MANKKQTPRGKLKLTPQTAAELEDLRSVLVRAITGTRIKECVREAIKDERSARTSHA